MDFLKCHRRAFTRGIISLLIVVAVSAAAFAQSPLPLGQPEYDFIYDVLTRNRAYDLDFNDYQIGPYAVDRSELERFGKVLPFPTFTNRLRVGVFASELSFSEKDTRSLNYESLRGNLTASPIKYVDVFTSVLLDEQKADDPEYTGKKWRGLAGDVDQAFVSYTRRRVQVIAGRFGGFWGPRRSLLFGSDQMLDGFAYKLKWGRLTVGYRLAQLDGVSSEDSESGVSLNRWLAAHRLDVHLTRRIRVGVFETVTFGGEGRSLDLWYLNPIIFFHGQQLNDGSDDNIMLGFDGDIKPLDGVRLYGQVVVDDIQVESSDSTDNEPDQLGYRIGGQVVNLWPSFDLNAEYTRVNNWTFNQQLPRNRYLNDSDPIGDVLGNDYEQAVVDCSYWLRQDLRLTLTGSWLRQGEGSIDADWTEPWLDESFENEFPSGVVEVTKSLSLGLSGYPFGIDWDEYHFGLFVDIRAGAEWVENARHVNGVDETNPFIQVRLSLFGLRDIPVN